MLELDKWYTLPWSDGSVIVNVLGEVKFLNDSPLSERVSNGTREVQLNWVLGDIWYDVGLIILFAVNQPNLKIDDVCKVRVVYKDEDRTNTFYSNLTYRFKEPVESVVRGYYVVPTYTWVAVNHAAECINLLTNTVLITFNWKASKSNRYVRGGYKQVNAISDHNQMTCRVGRHRMVALALLCDTQAGYKHVVNHIDGIPGNDTPDNLEWVTRSENVQHAYDTGLHPNKVKPVQVMWRETGELKWYSNASQAARELGISTGGMDRRLLHNGTFWFRDGTSVRLASEDEWVIDPSQTVLRTTFRRQTLVRDVFTGIITIHNSLHEAARKHEISMGAAEWQVSSEPYGPVNGKCLRYMSDNLKWPAYTGHQLEVYRRIGVRGSGILAISGDDSRLLIDDDEVRGFFGVTKNHLLIIANSGSELKGYKLKVVKPNEPFIV